jgi:elongation factor P--(R)-beta-lysine ligase
MKKGKGQLSRKEAFEKKQRNLLGRERGIRAIREYFQSLEFLEVQTPALQVSPGLEPHLQAFATDLIHPIGKIRFPLYLHTSPEFAMKKLLVSGLPKIFQIAQTFRNGERSNTHHPEFSLLEWYRAQASYEDLMNDCEGLVKFVAKKIQGASPVLAWQGKCATLDQPFEKISVVEAFSKFANIDLISTLDGLDPSPNLIKKECEKIGISCASDDRFEDIFFRIFLEKIEPNLGVGRPTILFDYPISMAALSRPKESDPRFAERFELYICGLELANAFGELTNAIVQRKRFEKDMALKEKLYGYRYPIDEDFLDALEEGMPESAGIALGVDRLMMLCVHAESINDVLWIEVAEPNIL